MSYRCDRCYNPLKVVEIEENTVRPSTLSIIRRVKTTEIRCAECGYAERTTRTAS